MVRSKRETCTECSIARIKCDRQIPCGRCVRRGQEAKCTREWPDRQTARSHRGPYRKSQVGSASSDDGMQSPDRPQTSAPHTSIDKPALGPQVSPSAASLPNGSLGSRRTRRTALPLSELNFPPLQPPPGSDGMVEGAVNGDTATDLEFLALGRDRPSVIDHGISNGSESIVNETKPSASGLSWALSTGFGSVREATITFLQLQLPSLRQIWHLVDYHERSLLWYHGCYHGPTFRQQLQDTISADGNSVKIQELNLQWVAILFSIMTGSMACATRSNLESWGFAKPEVSKLSKQWYKATITCLHLAEYTANHHIYAVHAIATLTMSAHTIGMSGELAVLLGAALKIAKSLGLDRVEYKVEIDTVDATSTDSHRRQVLQREKARRLWSQLCIQDWFSLPFSDSHCIHPTQFTTSKPANRDHLTMDHLADSIPTYVSYGNYLYEIARLIVDHHAAMLQSSTPFTKYEQVLEFDARMRKLATKGMPAYFHVTRPIDPTWPVFIPWARRSLTICFAHKVMMIHRTFMAQSFINPAFAITRKTCIAASKTILQEAKQERDEDGPIIWIDQAVCVAAGIFLCLDVFHRSEIEPEYTVHKGLVEECINMLQQFNNSMIAIRGVKLLSCLLSEREQSSHHSTNTSNPPYKHFDISLITRFLASDPDNILPDTDTNSPDEEDTITIPPASNLDTLFQEDQWPSHQFDELFPPQAGFSNSFLFDDLFHFDDLIGFGSA